MVCLEGEPLLEIANIVWVPRLNGLNETYKGVVGNLVKEMDFGNENAGRRVNRWVNDATNGLIPKIVMDGPLLDIVLLAVNTIYLKAQWAKPFSPSYTNNDQFYTTASRTTPLASTAHFSEYISDFTHCCTIGTLWIHGFIILTLITHSISSIHHFTIEPPQCTKLTFSITPRRLSLDTNSSRCHLVNTLRANCPCCLLFR